MTDEQIDQKITALFPDHPWEDDVPMPSTDWNDGGPLLESEEIQLDHSYAPGGWDHEGGVWRAYYRSSDGKYTGEGVAETMLRAGMLAIIAKHGG